MFINSCFASHALAYDLIKSLYKSSFSTSLPVCRVDGNEKEKAGHVVKVRWGVYVRAYHRQDKRNGGNDVLKFGVSEMQGWRKNHEDAHICTILGGNGVSRAIFGVWDGHGGKE